MKKTKRNIYVLCCSLACIAGVTALVGFVKFIPIFPFRIAALVGINLLNGVIAWIALRITGMSINIDVRNKRQYLIGAAMALTLSACIVVIPALCGVSLVGEHEDFTWFNIIYDFLLCMLIIGPVEEFVFRVYLQEALVSFFDRHKWLGVVIAAFLFGLWHIINGSMIQVLITFGIGLAFGFAKYKIKDCGYIGVALGHGLYDFLNTLVRMFIV
jgi:membrane protease YdiL (CAAX protease family)